LIILALAGAVGGCGSSNNNGDGGAPSDMSAVVGADMLLLSRCGHYGDTGNSLGVGQFCTNQGPDCSANSKAKSCSALFNGTTPSANDSYFCSFLCASTDPPGTCGENARCVCAAQGCACIHVRCIPNDAGT
jgi:hypothetical protein